jgi:hypothetical protein
MTSLNRVSSQRELSSRSLALYADKQCHNRWACIGPALALIATLWL